jgi:hypothetical protein
MEEISNIPSKFYFACRNNDLESVIQLLNELPLEDIDRMEPNNSTALHAACYYKHSDIIKLLLERGFTRRVLNKFNITPIDEIDNEEIRQLFIRSKTLNRFGGDISYEREKSIWIVIDGNQQNIINDRITDMYKGNRLEYGIFHGEEICQQLNNMPKLDVIRRLLRRAIEEKACTRLIQAYTAETDFYNHVNNYLLSRNENDDISQFVQIIYFNHQLHEKFSYRDLSYRSIRINSTDQLDLFKKGTKILNRTFISTTRNRQIAEEYVHHPCDNEEQIKVMIIFKIRQFYTALNVEKISEFPHEEEVLIMFDSIFEVKDVIQKEKFYFEVKLCELKSNNRR